MALTDVAIARIRAMIQSGELPPGTRLPPEHQLSVQMGISRSGIREAVKVLEAARVLDVRRPKPPSPSGRLAQPAAPDR
jgi:GntR family transcriptional repressor for pyruvate dehydrogenase complex